ncbi:MAG: thiamine pyrophosphate-dependent enzyme [Gammaproteobacteria bacterium]
MLIYGTNISRSNAWQEGIALWTAVQHDVHLVILALRNEEYAILKSLALLEKTPNVPGLDLPGLDLVSLAKGYGANAFHADSLEAI